MIQIILKKVKARNILNVANDENIFILIWISTHIILLMLILSVNI
jgi:hypothetical protein